MAIRSWRGRYLFAEEQDNRFFSLRMINGAMTDLRDHTAQMITGANPSVVAIASFGQDPNGELYAVQIGTSSNTGRIRKIIPKPTQPNLADIASIGQLAPPYNPDGLRTIEDLDAFLSLFLSGDDLADIASIGQLAPPYTSDGLVTLADLDAFFASFIGP